MRDEDDGPERMMGARDRSRGGFDQLDRFSSRRNGGAAGGRCVRWPCHRVWVGIRRSRGGRWHRRFDRNEKRRRLEASRVDRVDKGDDPEALDC